MTTTFPIEPGSLNFADALALLGDPSLIGEFIVKAMGDDMFPFSTALLRGRAAFKNGVAAVIPAAAPIAAEGVQQVAPGAEYPEVALFTREAKVIEALKRGYRAKITDESLSRDPMGITQALNDALVFLGNGVKVDFEQLATAAVADAPIPTFTGSQWSVGGEEGLAAMLTDVINAGNSMLQLRKGYTPQIIVVTMAQWAVLSPMLARSAGMTFGAPVTSGIINPWDPTNYHVSADLPANWQPTIMDPNFFGGVAHEVIDSEGEYVQVGPMGSGFEVSSYRSADHRDTRFIQLRKTDVPYIWNPDAALKITGTGL